MPDWGATPQDIANAAQACYSTADTVGGQLATLKGYVIALEAVWGGIAADTFQELMQLYDKYSARLNLALTDIGSGLHGNFVNYTDTEQANINQVNTILTNLQGAHLD